MPSTHSCAVSVAARGGGFISDLSARLTLSNALMSDDGEMSKSLASSMTMSIASPACAPLRPSSGTL
eukprot:5201267-Prymnesium_polylepis.1